MKTMETAMKVSRIFAGLLIILLGLALFLSNFDVLSLDWHFIFRLWPVLLVLAGISVLVSNSKLKAVLYALTAILVLVWIFSVASVGWGNFRGIFDGRHNSVHHQEFSQDLDKDIHHAVLSLNSGAGSFFLNDTTNTLFEANTESNIGDYSLNVEKDRDTEILDLGFNGDHENHWRFGGTRNKVNMKLNPKMDWALNMDIGACSVDFDLSQFAVTSADIKAGASSLKIKLGDKTDTARINVNTGVSSVKIDIPKEIGCQVRDEAKLSSKSFPDFVEVDDGLYRTANFETARKIIFVDIEAGVSSIKIRKY
jgi:LiaI-LiaF-like transmembrane region